MRYLELAQVVEHLNLLLLLEVVYDNSSILDLVACDDCLISE